MNSVKQHPSPQDIEALASNFEAFVRATEQLKASYERLCARAEKIDLELTHTNEKLRHKVEELDHLTGYLNGILAAIPCGVIVCDANNRITMVNHAAEKILELNSDAVTYALSKEIVDQNNTPILLNAAPIDGQKTRCVQLKKPKVLGGDISAIRNGDGQVVGYVEVIEDLTEIWNLKEKVHHLDKLAALGEMSAVIAHEIRNPLNGVQGFANLLAKNLPDKSPKLHNYAEKIVRGVQDVNAIITDLLEFASCENFAPRKIDILENINLSFQSSLSSLPSGRQNIELAITSPQEQIQIYADSIKLNQIFGNLFLNSFQAMNYQGKMSVKIESHETEISINIADQGPGIPQEVREKAFEPFFTTKTEGTGLGLAIVRKFIELHRGSIKIKEGEKGACFEIRLPLNLTAKALSA